MAATAASCRRAWTSARAVVTTPTTTSRRPGGHPPRGSAGRAQSGQPPHAPAPAGGGGRVRHRSCTTARFGCSSTTVGGVRVFITLTTDLKMQSHGVGMMEAIIAEIAPQARVIHYTHGIADYDTTSAARLLETVRFIMPAIHVCVCDPGGGTARRPLAILTHRGDIVIGPDNGALHPAVAALGGTAELRQISNPAVMRHPVSAVFHGRDVFCPTAAHLAHGLSFQLVGEPSIPRSWCRRPT